MIGEWVASVDAADVPAEGVENAKRAILDFCGVALAAGGDPEAAVLGRYAAAQGGGQRATAIGVGAVANAETAALIGGAMGHLLDFDDANDIIAGHPTAPMFPAILAVAEEMGANGADLVTAYGVGFEVQAALGRMVHFAHYEKGWHPTATLGVFGSAAAVSKMLRLDAAQTTAALGLAVASAAGVKASFGTLAKPIQVGRSAQAGLAAARFAHAGATARPDAFEHVQGFGEVYNGPDAYRVLDPAEFESGLWEVAERGVHVKLYPCGGATHSAIDSALAIRAQGERDAASIRSVRVLTHPRRLKHTNRPAITTPLEAKFSVQYGVATALLHGGVRLEHYTADAVASPEIARLFERMETVALPEERFGDEHFAAEVHVEYDDGTRLEARYERPRGRSAHDRLTRDDLSEKFRACAAIALDEGGVSQLETLLWDLERLGNVDELVNLLGASAIGDLR